MVNFGAVLAEEVASSTPEQRMFYLDYEALKKTLEAPDELTAEVTLLQKLASPAAGSTPAKEHNTPAVRFLRMVDNELEKLNSYVLTTVSSIEASVSKLFRHVATVASTTTMGSLESDAAHLGDKMIGLGHFVQVNHTGFLKIVKKFDKV